MNQIAILNSVCGQLLSRNEAVKAAAIEILPGLSRPNMSTGRLLSHIEMCNEKIAEAKGKGNNAVAEAWEDIRGILAR